ncbi:hypothetical protein BC834DRAFT_844639 [Gloeopeniophorella convolvens]|nr:hypothetical protein BC834DRAFT_844639 [Gloeopeniophorella convolvens]
MAGRLPRIRLPCGRVPSSDPTSDSRSYRGTCQCGRRAGDRLVVRSTGTAVSPSQAKAGFVGISGLALDGIEILTPVTNTIVSESYGGREWTAANKGRDGDHHFRSVSPPGILYLNVPDDARVARLGASKPFDATAGCENASSVFVETTGQPMFRKDGVNRDAPYVNSALQQPDTIERIDFKLAPPRRPIRDTPGIAEQSSGFRAILTGDSGCPLAPTNPMSSQLRDRAIEVGSVNRGHPLSAPADAFWNFRCALSSGPSGKDLQLVTGPDMRAYETMTCGVGRQESLGRMDFLAAARSQYSGACASSSSHLWEQVFRNPSEPTQGRASIVECAKLACAIQRQTGVVA